MALCAYALSEPQSFPERLQNLLDHEEGAEDIENFDKNIEDLDSDA